MSTSFSEGERPRPQEPTVVQIDPKCLRSALKEFFDPLRTNDPRTDFFAVYRKESVEFDRDYAKKYDEDLNTSLIFAGLFSAVSSAFIIDVQSKLEPDPNDMTAAYMRILIHTMNNSLFPDADSGPTTWIGPPPEIVTVQSLLYASLATSLLAAFLAMLGKQWVNRYLRNRGGSVADKSRDRQRKLDGLEKWHFHLAIESLPAMLQLALLLLGCALSGYLWAISRTVAGVTVAVTLFGVTSYVFLTLAATLYYNCPYQTPPSILTRMVIRYLAHHGATLASSSRSLIPALPSIKTLEQIIGCLRSGVRSVLGRVGCLPTVAEEAEHIPLVVVVTPPTRIFEGVPVDWDVCEADVRCISWVLYSTTDTDVIFSTVRFVADLIWYPEIAGALSPHILADLFFGCLLGERVIPGKVEYASSIGMALASVLSIQLVTKPADPVLRVLCGRVLSVRVFSPEPIFTLVVDVLRFVADAGGRPMFRSWELLRSIPVHLPTTEKLWLSRIILQTLWRWRRVHEPTKVLDFVAMGPICRTFAQASSDQTPSILKTNCFLVMAISLGVQIDIRDLYAPTTDDALRAAINLFVQQLQTRIREGMTDQWYLTVVLSASGHLSPFQVMGGELAISLITDILNSGYPESCRYRMASEVVRRLGKWFDSAPVPIVPYSWTPVLFGFLALCEKFYTAESPPHPGFIALRIASASPRDEGFFDTIFPVLTSTLLPTHPLQSRLLALRIFDQFTDKWLSPHLVKIRSEDLGELLQAVGDLFQFPDLPLQDGKPTVTAGYEPLMTTVLLIELASLDLWRDHLRHSNFTSCEEIVSTGEGKRVALKCMFEVTTHSWSSLVYTPEMMIAAIRRLEELRCFNTAEVVLLWTWTAGIVNPLDRDVWELIGDVTLKFYRAHGIRRLATLSQHITETTMAEMHIELLFRRFRDNPCRVRPLPVSVTPAVDYAELRISQACQLGRLYRLFGCDPTTWREMVAVGGVGGGNSVSSGCLVMPDQFTD